MSAHKSPGWIKALRANRDMIAEYLTNWRDELQRISDWNASNLSEDDQANLKDLIDLMNKKIAWFKQ